MGRRLGIQALAQRPVQQACKAGMHVDADELGPSADACQSRSQPDRQGRQQAGIVDGGPATRRVAQGQEGSASCGRAALFTMTGADFIADPSHAEEVFGAASLLVRCATIEELLRQAQQSSNATQQELDRLRAILEAIQKQLQTQQQTPAR